MRPFLASHNNHYVTLASRVGMSPHTHIGATDRAHARAGMTHEFGAQVRCHGAG